MQDTRLDELVATLLARPRRPRTILAVAGPPGSGKSTVAERLLEAVEAAEPGRAALLPMDGFHYDDMLLQRLGRQERKGAPDTFDVGGLRHMLLRLRANAEDEVCVPVFDRAFEIARAGARMIPASSDLVIVEGNYLLLDLPPWSDLQEAFDVSVMVQTDEDELRRRLVARWQGQGLGEPETRRKVEENDLPNGRFVIANSRRAEYRLSN